MIHTWWLVGYTNVQIQWQGRHSLARPAAELLGPASASTWSGGLWHLMRTQHGVTQAAPISRFEPRGSRGNAGASVVVLARSAGEVMAPQLPACQMRSNKKGGRSGPPPCVRERLHAGKGWKHTATRTRCVRLCVGKHGRVNVLARARALHHCQQGSKGAEVRRCPLVIEDIDNGLPTALAGARIEPRTVCSSSVVANGHWAPGLLGEDQTGPNVFV